MTVQAAEWRDVPKMPAVHAMYGGEPPRTYVAYVGITGDLVSRLLQHFDKRDSSVVTGTAAVGVNIDAIRFVDWWEHELFEDSVHRHAAELIGFRVFDPALRSRGTTPRAAAELVNDEAFVEQMEGLFRGPPTGRYTPPRLTDVATTGRP